MTQRYTIQAVIYPGDETVQNLRDAIHLHLEGEDLVDMGLVPHAPLLVTMEMDQIYA
jgi:hypothetical protein